MLMCCLEQWTAISHNSAIKLRSCRRDVTHIVDVLRKYPWFAERHWVSDWAARRAALSASVELRWSEWTVSGSFAITHHHKHILYPTRAQKRLYFLNKLLKATSRNNILVRGATESILTWSITARPRTGSSLQRLEHHCRASAISVN